MKKMAFRLCVLTCLLWLAHFANAQGSTKERATAPLEEKDQQIIIQKKKGKKVKLTVEIQDDAISINGKPLAEFKDDHITIRKSNGADILFDLQTDPFSLQMLPPLPNMSLGVEPFNFDDNEEEQTNNAFLGVSTEKHEDGARIVRVEEKTAAEKAGLKIGDVITKINSKQIDNPSELQDVISTYKPSDTITVAYIREGKNKTTQLALGKRKYHARTYARTIKPAMPREPDFDMPAPSFSYTPHIKLGMKIEDTDDAKGVKVLSVESDCPAEKAGLKKGDIITHWGGEAITDVYTLRRMVGNNTQGSVVVKVLRDGKTQEITMPTPKKLRSTNL
jgi:serine protease Do